MTRCYLRILMVGGLLSLTACAQQQDVRQIRNEVKTLNNEMTRLSDQAVKLTQQNALNKRSTSGVWLLPGSETPARLDSQIGMLKMSLSNVIPDAGGTRATLKISGESSEPLPAFTGAVEWGQIQGTLENFQEVNVQSQMISAPASVLAPSDVFVQLQMADITPEQLGFVRIHDIQPLTQ